VKVNDAFSGGLLVVFCLAVFYLTRDYPGMPGQDYGPALFPRLIATLAGIAGVALIVKGARVWRSEPRVVLGDWVRSPRHLGNFVVVVGALIVYIQVSDAVGFIITGFVLLSFIIVWLRGLGHLWSSLLVSALSVVVVQALFGELLRVPLPWGLLPPITF
jgi:putative tricarboxylic transport membrane protein